MQYLQDERKEHIFVLVLESLKRLLDESLLSASYLQCDEGGVFFKAFPKQHEEKSLQS